MFYKCNTCASIFCDTDKTIRHQSDYHNESTALHYELYYNSLRIFQSKDILKRLSHYEISGLRLLDVGCGNGVFVNEARNSGYDAIGIDISLPPANFIKSPDHVFKCELSAFVKSNEKFDVITSLNVLEHITDPNNFISGISALLNHGGIAVFAIPLSSGIVYRTCEFAHRFPLRSLKIPWKTILQWHTPSPHVFLPTISGLNYLIKRHFGSEISNYFPQRIVDITNLTKRIQLEKKQRKVGFLEGALLLFGGYLLATVGAFANLTGRPDEIFFFIKNEK